MVLDHIKLCNVRCYEQAELHPDPRFNVIVGLNGQGKTSILEAIGLLASLRSFRNAKNVETIRVGQPEGKVAGGVRHGELNFGLDVTIWPSRKQGTVNGKTCKYLSEYVTRLSAVSFSPSDLEIIRGGPENRRAWIDRVTQIFYPEHVDAMARFQKILVHRNRQLKALSEGRIDAAGRSPLPASFIFEKPPADFEVWTEELCDWGSKIIHKRIHTVDKIVEKIAQYYREISRENQAITIEYLSGIFEKLPCGQQSPSSLEIVAQALRNSVTSSLRKELALGTTMVGPHRDDLDIKMGGNTVRAFGSQGEVRSLVLAMRLLEADLYREVRGLNPILLIDDFSSELDARRRKYLLDYLMTSGSQIFLTTTEEIDLGKKFYVTEGKISV